MTKEEYLQSLDTTNYVSIPVEDYARQQSYIKELERQLEKLREEAAHD